MCGNIIEVSIYIYIQGERERERERERARAREILKTKVIYILYGPTAIQVW